MILKNEGLLLEYLCNKKKYIIYVCDEALWTTLDHWTFLK